MMINGVSLFNFKAFEELNIDFAPITILIGPNNSGKSSILAPIRLLFQTIESNDLGAPLIFNGIFGDFGTFKDLVFHNHRGKAIKLSLRVCRSNHVNQAETEIMLNYKWRKMRRELILKSSELGFNGVKLFSTEYSEDAEKHYYNTIGNEKIPVNIKAKLSNSLRMHHFIPQPRFIRIMENKKTKNSLNRYNVMLEDMSSGARNAYFSFMRIADNVEYISAMRIPPQRTYLFSGERKNRIGSCGENMSNKLALDPGLRTKKFKSMSDLASKWLCKAGIAKSLQLKALSDRHYEIRITHNRTGETQNLADVGYGNSQVLPVLIGGYDLMRRGRKYGSTYLVEEPEIHLHPKAQAELGTYFYDLYKGNVQSIIETHSEHLILRLQQHIAKKEINPNEIYLYYVYANEDGKKTAKRIRFKNNGTFRDEWPEGFFPERLEEAKKLAKYRYENQ